MIDSLSTSLFYRDSCEILVEYGVEPHEYGSVVNGLRKNPEAWLDFMMNCEILVEYGVEPHEYGSVVNGLRKNPEAWLDFMMSDSKQNKTAFVTFKDPKALQIALLLSEVFETDNAMSMTLENFSPNSKGNGTSPRSGRVYMSKAQDVVTSVLAKYSAIRQYALNKAKTFDEKHKLRTNATARVNSLDNRVGLSEKINVGVLVVNEEVKYVTAGTAWLNTAFGKVAKAGQVAGSKVGFPS
ncbi:hypothetical protein LXL04_003607 [Taraxacum kok-saghyz]